MQATQLQVSDLRQAHNELVAHPEALRKSHHCSSLINFSLLSGGIIIIEYLHCDALTLLVILAVIAGAIYYSTYQERLPTAALSRSIGWVID